MILYSSFNINYYHLLVIIFNNTFKYYKNVEVSTIYIIIL